ncbi:MAG: LVIVD repeat-containing protein [Actinomycetota bacterium]
MPVTIVRGALALSAAALVALPAIPSASGRARPGSSPRPVGSIEISEAAGLGRVEVHGDTAAVLQRDEGIVALVDIENPKRPRVLGRFDDDARQSLDGDLAFSSDGRWLFYARQTRQFYLDGLLVLDVADPSSPRLAGYTAAGGTLRVAYHDAGDSEWVVTMDAVEGLTIARFDPQTGVVVPVTVQPLPEPTQKVGGPASAGIVIDDDPMTGKTLLYASTGKTGVEVFDFTDPVNPAKLGGWEGIGLAELQVASSARSRTIYAATEYWFDDQLAPEVVVLDATDLSDIRKRGVKSIGKPADDAWRVQGMELVGGRLLVAHSHAGLVSFPTRRSGAPSLVSIAGRRNPEAGVVGEGPYAFDVDARGGLLFLTDAATGVLSILRGSAP